MRILYGIAGDGLGHAVRSSVVIDELLRAGHEVQAVVSGDAETYMERKYSSVTKIWGLSVETRGHEVREGLTIASNIRQGLSPAGLPRNIYKCFEVAREFDPDLVISDHELWSWCFGKFYDLPILGLDNIHFVSRCDHPDAVMEGLRNQYPLAELLVEARVPSADHYLIPNFAWPDVAKEETTLVPPVLRPEILNATPERGDHLLVYQTSYSNRELVPTLRQLDCPVKIYGALPDGGSERTVDNVTFRPFDESRFFNDLASCRAVAASAGFTLLCEALHLGKPYLGIPVVGQVEQMLNARYIDWLDYGTKTLEPDVETFRSFLSNLDRYRSALADYERYGNEPTFEKLFAFLDDHAPARQRPLPARQARHAGRTAADRAAAE